MLVRVRVRQDPPRCRIGLPSCSQAHPALLVDNLASLITALTTGGVAVRDDEPLEGYHRVYVDDPFGNRIELMELAP